MVTIPHVPEKICVQRSFCSHLYSLVCDVSSFFFLAAFKVVFLSLILVCS